MTVYTCGCVQGRVVLKECFLDRAVHEPGFHGEADRSVDWQAEGLSLEQENNVLSSTEVQTPDPVTETRCSSKCLGHKVPVKEWGWLGIQMLAEVVVCQIHDQCQTLGYRVESPWEHPCIQSMSLRQTNKPGGEWRHGNQARQTCAHSRNLKKPWRDQNLSSWRLIRLSVSWLVCFLIYRSVMFYSSLFGFCSLPFPKLIFQNSPVDARERK